MLQSCQCVTLATGPAGIEAAAGEGVCAAAPGSWTSPTKERHTPAGSPPMGAWRLRCAYSSQCIPSYICTYDGALWDWALL